MPASQPVRPAGGTVYTATWYRRAADPRLHIQAIGVRKDMPAGGFTYRGRHRCWQLMIFHDPVRLSAAGCPEVEVPAQSAVLWSLTQRPAWYGHLRQPWSHSWVLVTGSMWDGLLAACPLPLLTPLPLPQPGAAALCLNGLALELSSQRQPDADILCCHLAILVRQLHRGAGAANDDRRMWWARSHLDQHLDRHIDLAVLARDQGMSVRQFSRCFVAAWGLTPQAYHLQARLAHAAGLLRQPGMTVAEVARQVGYADGFTFSKAFSRWAGVPPTRFR